MAIWVEGEGHPDAICGTAPRGSDPANPTAGLTPTERAWRDFVLNVQRHDCFDPKCKVKNGERIDYCKYLYPRPLSEAAFQLSAETNRYEYRTLQAEDQWLSPYVPLWLLATGASMNMQYCTTAGFLSYIAKYVCKPEPHGIIGDSGALRARNGDVSPQMHFLNARIVGAPEVIFRLFGYEMKHGRAVTHLCTRPPGARRRAMARLNVNARDVDAFQVRFFDGTLEQYARRPEGIIDGINFSDMLYPEFHRAFEVKKWRDMSAGQRERTSSEMRCILLPGEHEGAMPVDDVLTGEPHAHSKWVVARESRRPVWYDWMLPSKHGALYFYQRLLLRTPWRDSLPESFIKSYTTNPLGSLRRECELRGVLGTGEDGLREAVTGDAARRCFSPESVEAMLAQEDMLDAVQPMLDAMTADALGGAEGGDGGGGGGGGDGRDGGVGCRGGGDDDAEEAGVDAARLRNEISNARYEQPPSPAPRLEESPSECYEGTAVPIVTWHEPGAPRPHVLKLAQYEAYTLLKQAGEKQLHAFLSGEGGVGKSTVTRLLIMYWRSQGLRVIVLASSAKAARLIGGHTVHSACLLSTHGTFEHARLEGCQASDRFVWLATADVVIIDEISVRSRPSSLPHASPASPPRLRPAPRLLFPTRTASCTELRCSRPLRCTA